MSDIAHSFAPPHPVYRSRREFLRRAGNGFGLLALAGLMEQEGMLVKPASSAEPARDPTVPKPTHFPPRAKAVIWLFINGGPSHVDTWDYKPELQRRDGQDRKSVV